MNTSKKMNKETPLQFFSESGFPEIKCFDSYFTIKARDFHNERLFYFSDVKRIDFYHPTHRYSKWVILLFPMFYRFATTLGTEPWVLKIHLRNGGDWEYMAKRGSNMRFRSILSDLQKAL